MDCFNSGIYLFVCFILTVSSVDSDDVIKKPTKRHPLLFFNYEDIPMLRERSQTTHRHLAEELRTAAFDIRHSSNLLPPITEEKFGRSWNEIFGNNMPPLALHQLLSPDKKTLNLIKVYMDRMAGYSKWQVTSSPEDEVPLAHHIAGFATALDFVYNDLDSTRQKVYVQKVGLRSILSADLKATVVALILETR